VLEPEGPQRGQRQVAGQRLGQERRVDAACRAAGQDVDDHAHVGAVAGGPPAQGLDVGVPGVVGREGVALAALLERAGGEHQLVHLAAMPAM
jgi:hypothetical protein